MSKPTNWDDFEKLIHAAMYNDLRVAPEERPLLLAAPTALDMRALTKMAQIAFETFGVPALWMIQSATLGVVAAGSVTGLAVEFGARSVTVTPVFDGYAISAATVMVPIGGDLITDHLMRLLTERGYSFTTTAEREIVRDIKEKLCFVTPDFEGELALAADGGAGPDSERTYELPDGQVITISSELFRAPEILFRPALAGVEAVSLPDAILVAVMRTEPELRRELLSRIVITGGPSATRGLGDRIELELARILPDDVISHVVTSSARERKYATWIGGSIIGSLTAFHSHIITADEFNACGPAKAVARRMW
ncbi:actin [Thecamonas trahens ATCC 50062]|uniref:Actin n=1 Tax=Thecamonas trahens ATCC 50062 TaxID=461836 RepID=A0A0L0D7N3_THETB|nr:actin [Thecamonas trahens ATCC 50062]KNC48215.1 actin [Thecamonas trahens ATCC 50062]|eukprot:XP_013758784.1 actin [Thecamonas trahens ATCC 50062]